MFFLTSFGLTLLLLIAGEAGGAGICRCGEFCLIRVDCRSARVRSRGVSLRAPLSPTGFMMALADESLRRPSTPKKLRFLRPDIASGVAAALARSSSGAVPRDCRRLPVTSVVP